MGAKLGMLLGKPIHQEVMPCKDLVLPHGKVGIEIETEGWDGAGASGIGPYWEFKEDGSLRNNGMEFITRGGLVGQAIIDATNTFCKWAQKRGLSVGYPRAGIHIHLDCTDLDWERGDLARLVALYMLIEPALFGYAGEWRRSCGFADTLVESEHTMEQLRTILVKEANNTKMLAKRFQSLERYFGLNLKSLSKFGTLEFRHLETTYDAKRIIGWINIILRLKKAAMEWDTSRDILVECSRNGVAAFCRSFMGAEWSLLECFFDEKLAWQQVDNIINLMLDNTPVARGHGPERSWDNVDKLNPLLSKKRSKAGAKKAIDRSDPETEQLWRLVANTYRNYLARGLPDHHPMGFIYQGQPFTEDAASWAIRLNKINAYRELRAEFAPQPQQAPRNMIFGGAGGAGAAERALWQVANIVGNAGAVGGR